MQASLYWSRGDELVIDLLPDVDAYSYLIARQAEGSNTELKNVMADFWPKRFAERFCQIYLPSLPLSKIPDKKLKEFSDLIHNWKVIPGKTVGYKKAEVTRGGVDTDELSSKSMESRKCPGLYFVGEVVDVTGQLGGYNFQWAWAQDMLPVSLSKLFAAFFLALLFLLGSLLFRFGLCWFFLLLFFCFQFFAHNLILLYMCRPSKIIRSPLNSSIIAGDSAL